MNRVLKCGWVALGLVMTALTARAEMKRVGHPLDPLSEPELLAAVRAIRADARFAPEARFASLTVREPDKAEVLAGKAGTRRAHAVMLEPRRNRVTEVTVELAGAPKPTGTIVDSRVVDGVQPPILLDEYDHAAELVRADARWQAALSRRGVTRFDQVHIDCWAPGLLSDDERASGHRYMRGLSYWKGTRHNPWAHPIEGVIVTIDVTEDKVVQVIDQEELGRAALSEAEDDFDGPMKSQGTLRPLQISMPRGASFTIEGSQVRWQGYSFRRGLDPVKGLVLYDLGFADEPGKTRPVLYKGSLSEMVVPYGDGAANWAFRNAFDVGEYGLGRSAHSLERGIDVPQHAALFDAVFVDDRGELMKIPRAIAIYERDAGVMWKHVEEGQRKGAGRRARELVVSFMTTIGNYDYSVEWALHQDGVIDVNVYLTGVLLAKGTDLVENPCDKACKRLVAPRIIAPSHQHFFSFRIDLDVDGATDNRVVESNVHAAPAGETNRAGNAFDVEQTPLATEQAARRDPDPGAARCWKVMSTTARNRLGHPTGYALKPGEIARPYLVTTSPIRRRAAFVDHALWATRYHDGEQSAAGDYVNQSRGGDGLPVFQRDDESLQGTDVVLWYTVGVTHVPRPEEWPVMNVHRAGFSLWPVNFFSRNPGLSTR